MPPGFVPPLTIQPGVLPGILVLHIQPVNVVCPVDRQFGLRWCPARFHQRRDNLRRRQAPLEILATRRAKLIQQFRRLLL